MSESLTFVTYTDKKGEFRWRLEAANGKSIAASGEGYKEKRDRDHAIDLIVKGASKAKVKEAESASEQAAAKAKPKAAAKPAVKATTKAKPKAAAKTAVKATAKAK